MPNSGRPSRGCHACRTRKIKCDETRPSCQRCLTTDRVCPGYRDTSDLTFRDMRSTAERKVQTRVRERTNQRQAEEDSLSTPSISRRPSLQKERSSSTNTSAIIGRTSASISPDRAGPSLSGVPKAVDLDWKSLSLDHFFLDYVLRVRRIGSMPGHLDFLPEMCREQPRNSCLMEGLYAVALARIAKQSSLTHFAMQARRSYGRALTLLNAALRDTKQAKQDSTLTTVSMLSMYEVRRIHECDKRRAKENFRSSAGINLNQFGSLTMPVGYHYYSFVD